MDDDKKNMENALNAYRDKTQTNPRLSVKVEPIDDIDSIEPPTAGLKEIYINSAREAFTDNLHYPGEVDYIKTELSKVGATPKDLDPTGTATDEDMEAALKEKKRKDYINEARNIFEDDRHHLGVEGINNLLSKVGATPKDLDPTGTATDEEMEVKLNKMDFRDKANLADLRIKVAETTGICSDEGLLGSLTAPCNVLENQEIAKKKSGPVKQ